MKINYLIIAAVLLTLSYRSVAQLTADAEFRPRTEWRSGFNQPLPETIKPAFFTVQRTRLNFNYQSALVNAKITLQDARTFGETDIKQPTSATTGSLGIYEAWAEILLMSGTSFKVGRQALHYEDGRIFSQSPWSNTGNSHDLMLLSYRNNATELQIGYAFNNQKVLNADSLYYSVPKMYRQLAFLHLTKTLREGLTASSLLIDEGMMRSGTDLSLYHRYTTGGTVQFSKEKSPFSALLTGYYQFGKSTPKTDLRAYLLAIKSTYNLSTKNKVNLGVDYYSGSTTTLQTTKTNTFIKLPYGTNHSFNGFMEYWGTLPKGGLVNYYVGTAWQINKKVSAEINYYAFDLARTMKIGTHQIKNNIGSELDLIVNYKISAVASLQMAWCTYLENDKTKLLKYNSSSINTRFPQYAYLMLTIKPKFI